MRTSALFLTATFLVATAAAGEFPLKDGDVWVMAGDSITAQHLHSNYFEAFCYARYPKLKFAFRNSGVGGHTIPSTLARFDYDIAAWKPTVVSVELGMNDKGGTMTDKFIANMGTMVGRIREIKARPVILSASPVNDGTTMAKLGGNQRLHEYAVALKDYCAREQIPYGDQFHALVDVWGKNKANESLATALNNVRIASQNKNFEGLEHLKAFLAANEKKAATLVSMQGDAVHPGAPGQLMMAAALLKELGADAFVSSVALDLPSKQTQAKGCVVEGLQVTDNSVTFDRLDERSPFPIPEDARGVLALDPTILDMSQYTLKITGLKPGSYALKINNTAVATVTAEALAAGVNLTALGNQPGVKTPNAISEQGKAILSAIGARAAAVGQWRGISKNAIAAGASDQARKDLAATQARVEALDERIREAAAPRKMRVSITAIQ
jgi:lysophospholipase L1-like esterase